jgi:hypothetical protein
MCTKFGTENLLLVAVLPQDSTISAGVCCDTLKKLHHVIQNKRFGMLSWGVVMLHDNARLHTAAATQDLIVTFGWEQFILPPYSPDLAPSDFHVFLHLKTFHGGQWFHNNSKKQLTHGLYRRQHHSTMQGYKNWYPTMTIASTMGETMSKSTVWYVHQMAI